MKAPSLADGCPKPLLDLDDPGVLVDLHLKPSDVVRRNRDHTREVANAVWRSKAGTGLRGLTWWSYRRPEWTVAVVWSEGLDHPYFPGVDVTGVERLHGELPAVRGR